MDTTWFEVDWSFVLIVVGLLVLSVGLAGRHVVLRRRRAREERRAARRAHRQWLEQSGLAPLDRSEGQGH